VAPVEIERITNDEIRAGTWQRGGGTGDQFAVAPRPLPAAQQAPLPASAAVGLASGAAASPVAAPGPADVPVPSAMVSPAVSTAPIVAAAQPEATALPALAPMPPPPQRAELAADAPSPGFWVQIGAFSQAGGASGLRDSAARGVPSLGPQLKVFSERGVYRVQAGPFASREAAQGTAEQLRASLQLSPMVVERR